MKVTILEDRPWVMEGCIRKMREMGLEVVEMLYYYNIISEREENLHYVEKMCRELNLQLCCVDNGNFEEQLNKLYEVQEMLFFFDMDLIGDYSSHFDERINTIYAKKKKKEDGGDGRIWFYTSGPASAVEQIDMCFEHRRIPVVDFDTQSNQIVFDYDFIQKNILGQE